MTKFIEQGWAYLLTGGATVGFKIWAGEGEGEQMECFGDPPHICA